MIALVKEEVLIGKGPKGNFWVLNGFCNGTSVVVT